MIKCTAIIKKSGLSCDRPGIVRCLEGWRCGIHSRHCVQYPVPLAIFHYGQNGINLQEVIDKKEDYESLDLYPDADGDNVLMSLNGYMNVKIGWPVLNQDVEPMSSVIFHTGSKQGTALTRAFVAHSIANTVKYVLDHPEMYVVSGYELKDIYLLGFTFRSSTGLFHAVFKV